MQCTRECCICDAKTVELIELPSRMVNGVVDLRNCALHGHAHWRQLANMVKQLCTVTMSGTATRSLFQKYFWQYCY